ncbi:hypothetical protein [Virgibacillus sp. DJP39]|uniref:hypothetical protein n=1 Tax=Virgibacillus sp. DJP39 TaxID=3409790 RepID=UPI003BB5ECFC
MLEEEKEFIMLNLSKDEIVNKKMYRVRKTLKELEKDIDRNYKCLHILFDGYNDIPDEIYSIQAIRDFCDELIKKDPKIVYFLEDKLEGLQNILLCISDLEALYIGEKKTIKEMYDEDPSTFVERQMNLPRTQIKMTIPKHKFDHIIKGLVKFGYENDVMGRVEELGNELGDFLN